MEHYKKFYEIGVNRYYTINVDDEMYIGTESFLNLGKKKLFRKQKELNMGFKLLKFSAPIAQLFNAMDNLKPTKKQKYNHEDMITYEHIDNKKLKEDIKQSYFKVINDETQNMLKQQADLLNEGKTELAASCEAYIEKLKNIDPLNGIVLGAPTHTGCMILRTMLREGLEHLYTEPVNAFTKNVYLYEQDCFGTLTIYRLITVKGVVKTIDTFIYDREVIGSLLKTLYEEGR